VLLPVPLNLPSLGILRFHVHKAKPGKSLSPVGADPVAEMDAQPDIAISKGMILLSRLRSQANDEEADEMIGLVI
jgi:hypothetical protein